MAGSYLQALRLFSRDVRLYMLTFALFATILRVPLELPLPYRYSLLIGAALLIGEQTVLDKA